MDFEGLKAGIREQLSSKALFEQAKAFAFEYMDNLEHGRVYPNDGAIAALDAFDEPMPDAPSDPSEILNFLHRVGSKAAVSQSGGRYFGFVNGSNFPVAIAAKWMSDVWDQRPIRHVPGRCEARGDLREMDCWPVGLTSGDRRRFCQRFVHGDSLRACCGP